LGRRVGGGGKNDCIILFLLIKGGKEKLILLKNRIQTAGEKGGGMSKDATTFIGKSNGGVRSLKEKRAGSASRSKTIIVSAYRKKRRGDEL